MTEPLVSILIPTYNGERFLRPALRSALEQSHRTIEVIVGDDGSTDRTAAILAAAAAADDRIRLIRHERNVGPYANFMHLLEAARGEYVKFLLHDDVLATDCVRELVRGMESTPQATLAFSHRTLIDEEGRPVPGQPVTTLRDRAGVIDGWELGDAVLESCANYIGEFTTMLWRRSDLDLSELWEVDGRRLDVITDVKVALMLLARGPAFYTPRTLSRFRVHQTQNGRNAGLIARSPRDWAWVIDWARRQGFLRNPDRERRAHATALATAAARIGQLLDDAEHGPCLEAVFLSTARLVELSAGHVPDPAESFPGRVHGPDSVDRFRQELDVWSREYPVAVAVPRLDADEVRSTVDALREVLDAGVAKQAVAMVDRALVGQAIPLFEAALADGPDIDIEVVPTDDPGSPLLDTPWLAVAPRDSTWHDGKATAVWRFEARQTA